MQLVDEPIEEHVTSWRRSPWVALVVVTLIGAIQLGIPISLAGADHQPRFAWQMFSGNPSFPEFQVVTTTGEQTVPLEDHLAGHRSELDLERLLPPHICSTTPDAIRVTWDSGEFEC